MSETMDAPQGSVAWYEARLGRPTASNFGAVVGRKRNGEPLKARTDYQFKLVAERLAGLGPQVDTPAMARGRDLEPTVVALYQHRNDGVALEEVGFVVGPNGLYGASPDRLVGSDGVLEVKTTAPHLYIADILTRGIPERFKWQMVGQLLVTGRKWCDLAQYCEPLGAMRVERLYRDDDDLRLLEEELAAFCAELEVLEEEALELLSEERVPPDLRILTDAS